MTGSETDLLKENERLKKENENLSKQLEEASIIIKSIKEGKIDAVYTDSEKKHVIYVPHTADRSYKTFTEQLPEGVIALYPDGVILYANSCFTEIINNDVKLVLGRNLVDFIAPQSKETFDELLKKAKKENCKGEIFILNKKGESIPYMISLKCLQLEKHLALSVVLTDLTKIKEGEAKLISANKQLAESIEEKNLANQKSRTIARQLKEKLKQFKVVNARLEAFAYITSHHLQEPLRKIRTFGGLLRTQYFVSLEERARHYIDRIDAATSKMQKMIEDVLAYSKLAVDETFQPCNLNTILKEVLTDLEIKIKETAARIIVNKPLPTIQGNPTQLQQLFLNIIDNSLKFHKKDTAPEIKINYRIIQGIQIPDVEKSRHNKRFYEIKIEDNGIGFSNKYAEQIFLLFKQLQVGLDFPGTGIGLAICEKVVDNHNGFISASSEENVGTVITICLPVDDKTDNEITKEPRYILIADDDPDDRNLMEMAFAETNSPVNLEFVVDGEELINSLNNKIASGEKLPDLILLDLNMPRKDGRVALQEIKADLNLSNLNIIIFSTSKSPEDVKMVLDLGANDFFSKPSDFNKMVELFAKLLNMPLKE